VKTLNYAPGPCDTDMQKDVRENSEHAPTREFYAELHRKVSVDEERGARERERLAD
jgi:hypothetical protein